MSKRRGKSGKAQFFGPASARFKALKPVKKEVICTAVPTMGHMMTDALHRFLRKLDLMSLYPECPYSFRPLSVNNHSHIPFARNALVKQFLADENNSRLWFIDSDILPLGDEDRLLEVNADIAAGVYPIMRQSGMHRAGPKPVEFHPQLVASVYDFSEERKKWRHTEMTDGKVVEKGGAGTGMMVIRRKVFEDKRMRLPDTWESLDGTEKTLGEGEAPPFFREILKANGAKETTDDLEFCYRAVKNGYKIMVDTSVLSDHLKPSKLLDVAYLSREAYEAGKHEGEYMGGRRASS